MTTCFTDSMTVLQLDEKAELFLTFARDILAHQRGFCVCVKVLFNPV